MKIEQKRKIAKTVLQIILEDMYRKSEDTEMKGGDAYAGMRANKERHSHIVSGKMGVTQSYKTKI